MDSKVDSIFCQDTSLHQHVSSLGYWLVLSFKFQVGVHYVVTSKTNLVHIKVQLQVIHGQSVQALAKVVCRIMPCPIPN